MAAWTKVDLIGNVSHEEALKIQQSSDAGMAILRPSNNTGGKQGSLGNTKIFEYMMSGIPVICTNFILWKEIINKFNCGICVEPNNNEEIAKAISYIKNNTDEALKMGENGRKAVEKEFNWETQEKKLLDLYTELFKEKNK